MFGIMFLIMIMAITNSVMIILIYLSKLLLHLLDINNN